MKLNNKNVLKSESIPAYLERGGKIKRCGRAARTPEEVQDLSAIVEAIIQKLDAQDKLKPSVSRV